MRKLKLVSAVLLLCLLVSPLSLGQAKKSAKTSAGGSAEETIKSLNEQLNQAAMKGDASVYEKLVSDDYVSIGITGMVSTKADLIANYKSGKTKFDSINPKDTKIRVYGDVAIVIGTADVKGHTGNTDISGQYRSTRVWLKRNGKWQSVSFQATRVQQ